MFVFISSLGFIPNWLALGFENKRQNKDTNDEFLIFVSCILYNLLSRSFGFEIPSILKVSCVKTFFCIPLLKL